MASKATQYTVRNVPRSIDQALRKKAAAKKVSLNALLLSALESEAGLQGPAKLHHDLDSFFGSWVADPRVDRALSELRKVDPGDWE